LTIGHEASRIHIGGLPRRLSDTPTAPAPETSKPHKVIIDGHEVIGPDDWPQE
jgi:hypothetical protein